MSKLTSIEVRAFALEHDHLAIPIRPGVRIVWIDEETGEVLGSATLKGRNVVKITDAGRAAIQRKGEAG